MMFSFNNKKTIIGIIEKAGIKPETKCFEDVVNCRMALMKSIKQRWFKWCDDFIEGVIDDYVWGF